MIQFEKISNLSKLPEGIFRFSTDTSEEIPSEPPSEVSVIFNKFKEMLQLEDDINVRISIGKYLREDILEYPNSVLVEKRVLLHFGDPEVYFFNYPQKYSEQILFQDGNAIEINFPVNVEIPKNTKRWLPDNQCSLQNKDKHLNVNGRWHIRPRNYLRYTVIIDLMEKS